MDIVATALQARASCGGVLCVYSIMSACTCLITDRLSRAFPARLWPSMERVHEESKSHCVSLHSFAMGWSS